MQDFRNYLVSIVALVATAFVVVAPPARAKDISGTIASTLTITDDSKLIGNVTCSVSSGPCISFGASHISLNLNGFIIDNPSFHGTLTGPSILCALTPLAAGIDTNGQSHVKILGPGVVRGFPSPASIFVNGGSNNKITGVTVSTFSSCIADGIGLLNTSSNDVDKNTFLEVPVHLDSYPGSVGIEILADGSGATSNDNHVENNECIGFSIGIRIGVGPGASATGNLIENNNVAHNQTGIVIETDATGNSVHKNQVFDNGYLGTIIDINDANAAGANSYHDNLCDVSTGTGAATACPNIANIAGHENAE
jgi:parallel beta-helix repeat protein